MISLAGAALWQALLTFCQLMVVVVVVYLDDFVAAGIALLLAAGLLSVLRRIVGRTSALAVRSQPAGRSAIPAECELLAAIAQERLAGESRIDALAWAFDQHVARIVTRGRSPDDVCCQRPDPPDAVHP